MNKIFFLSLLIVLGLACENPFSTRKAEPPDTRIPSTFVPPTNPEFVFLNLQFAFLERNVENYILSFVDSTRSQQRFTFVPEEVVAEANPGSFADWGLESERRYLSLLLQTIAENSLSSLTFVEDEDTPPNIGSESATFTQNYELVVKHSLANIPTEFRGQSIFRLERNDTGDWAIYSWEDFTNDVDPSWSELKALFQ